MEKTYYVYEHCRASDDTVFYIGVGSGKRFKTKDNRNIHWHRIVKKHGFTANILADGLSLDDAYKMEVALIKKHGRDNLANMTDGGDGVKNPSLETRQKMRAAKVGKKQTSEHISKRVDAIRSNPCRKNKPSSGFRHVTWHKRAKKWASAVSENGRHIHLGLFDCKFEAWLKALEYKGAIKR